MKTCFIGLAAVFCMTFVCAADALPKEGSDTVKAFVSILPQKYFLERVGGDRVRVSVLVGPGSSPHTYEPTPRQMTELAQADIFFRIGVPFENVVMPKIQALHKGLTVVDTRDGIELRKSDEDHNHEAHTPKPHKHDSAQGRAKLNHKHRSEAEDDHHHEAGELDPHIWLDPVLVKRQAETMCSALIKIDPAHEKTYRENLKKFESDLDEVNSLVAKALSRVKGKEIFVFHPAYGYFADRYGLKQRAVETGGKEPGAKQLAALIDRAKKAGVKVIFVQPQFDRKNATTIARAIGGAVIPLDPLAPDYLENLRDMARKVESALSAQQ
ncbi:MAG: zinc ABC transporter substrate-binding protein [Thermodesulfobacteriota bacterium]